MSLLAAHVSLPIYPHGQREMSGDGGGVDDQGRVSGPGPREMRSDAEEEEEERERKERRNRRKRGPPKFRTATTTTVMTHSYAEVIVEALLKYAKIVSTGCGRTHGNE